MLHIFQKKNVAKKIWITLAVLIIPPFVFWGAGSMLDSKKNPDYAGSLFGHKVPYQEYMDNLAAVRTSAMMRFGEEFDKIEKYIDLPSQAWERIMLLEEARNKKVKVSDKEVIEQIRSFPFFQEKGEFNISRYKQALQYGLNIPARKFEEQIRGTLILQKLYESLTSGLKVSDEEIKKEYELANEKVKITYIAALPANFLPKDEPTEDELLKFYNQKIEKFRIEMAADVQYVGLPYPLNASEEQKDKINVTVREAADNIKPNEDLVQLAKKNNLEIKNTGYFNINEPIPGIGLSPVAWDTITRMKKGQISDAITTQGGSYILKLIDKKTDYTPDFKEAKEKAVKMLKNEKGLNEAKKKMTECSQELQNNPGLSFKEAAQKYSLVSASPEPFNRSSYIPGVGNFQEFVQQAFSLKDPGEISAIVETPSGFYLLQLEEKIKVPEETFNKEKTEFSQNLLERKKSETFSSFVTELRKKANIKFNHK